MVRELRRLLIQPQRLAALGGGQRLELEPAESHYLRRVLRCRPGEVIALVDGAGALLPARLEADGSLRLEPAGLERQPASPCRIQLALALPRREVELVWRMATELGVDGLQPLLAQRCQPQPLPLERWRAIVAEALEQSERLWLPPLEPPQPAAAWLATPTAGLGLLATTRRQGLPALETLLARAIAAAPPPSWLRLAVGPEGGWTDAEEDAARQGGWQAVSLGPTILRSSTAAIAGLARLVSWRTLSCAADRRPGCGSAPDQRLPDGGATAGHRD
ncbi:MAG: RsmE family RNA methyltransferase [Synechococcaceae cyanobacterium]|nr:RsmE family RNA methyltransferase [Synechococcaceae cyanobacterium]